MSAPLIEAAIERLRDLIASGQLRPGDRLPRESELAAQLGMSRNTAREAVRALVTARVLDVRRGDGTYVTSLRPELLFDGIAFAAEILQPDYSLELVGVRRILEGAAAGLAARNIDDAALAELASCLEQMRNAETHEVMVGFDAKFHALVASAAGNATLASMLAGVSGQTMRARVWRGNVDEGVVARTILQHEDIYAALVSRDAALAEAMATVHVATTEAWIRSTMGGPGGGPLAPPKDAAPEVAAKDAAPPRGRGAQGRGARGGGQGRGAPGSAAQGRAAQGRAAQGRAAQGGAAPGGRAHRLMAPPQDAPPREVERTG